MKTQDLYEQAKSYTYLSRELLVTDSCWERESWFSLMEWHWVYQPQSRGGSMLSQYKLDSVALFFVGFLKIFIFKRDNMKLGKQGGRICEELRMCIYNKKIYEILKK